MTSVLIGVIVGLFYVSGFLLWPLFALFWRKKRRRTTALRWVFLIELLCLLVLLVLASSGGVKLEHGYYWFIIWVPLNLLFTLAALAAATLDYARTQAD